VRGAAHILRGAKLPMEFCGFVEGDDIAEGTVDVVVTDGFTGNIALKTAEGTAKLVVHFLRTALAARFWGASALSSRAGALGTCAASSIRAPPMAASSWASTASW
jgi:glycerol-3-phosphate acyltransferase PlsX